MNVREWQQMNDHYEVGFWDTCVNTASEEHKQYTYMRLMGVPLVKLPGGGAWYFEALAKSIVDIGGGPASPLLKVRNWTYPISVVDPGKYPDWVNARYEAASIRVFHEPAETWEPDQRYDEAWLMNCLQHTQDPFRVVETARRAAATVRVFEWIEYEPAPGHPHQLHAPELDEWFMGEGSVQRLGSEYQDLGRADTPPRQNTYSPADNNADQGLAYFGVFPTS